MTAPRTPILLRPWTPSDDQALLDIFAASDDLGTQYPLPVEDLAAAAECRQRMLGWDATRRNLAIVVDGAAVGNVAVSAIDRRHHVGWVSYFSSGRVRGRGLVGRATAAAATWALSPAGNDPDEVSGGLGLFRLELGHRVNNPASGAVAAAAGFVQEGRERAKLRYGDQRFDTLTWARLATDPVPATDGVVIRIG